MKFKTVAPRRFLSRIFALNFVSILFVCAFVWGAPVVPVSAQKAEAARETKTARASKGAKARGAEASADVQAAVERISAASMRGHLSFIASDLLEGRDTPSRGLDTAAEYIAAQFRRAGLEPVGDDGYFQTATWSQVQRTLEGFELTFNAQGREIAVNPRQVSLSYNVGTTSMWGLDVPVQASRAAILKLDYKDAAALSALPAEQVAGKVVFTELPDLRRESGQRRFELYREENEFLTKLAALKPALVVLLDRSTSASIGAGWPRLVNPERRGNASASARRSGPPAPVPLIVVHGEDMAALYDALRVGANEATASVRAAAPVERPIKLRNVVGLLRGSDPALKDTYIIVSAHYDHIGISPQGEGDRIYNGANDDGSGTVSVVELASALATLKQRPRRSILFMTYFGEERGGLGSRFYAQHPIFPIEKTIANVNLEQLGRTDDTEGPRVATFNLTGFDYSDLGAIFQHAGEATGVRVFKHPTNSDLYFSRSDNQSLADMGVPAHTVSVAYAYPDYHGTGDHWEKIDYENMAKVNRTLAVGILSIANNPQAPRWDESNPKAAAYVKAWHELHGK